MADEVPVIINSDREQLAAFISSLLQQPRRIEDIVEGQKFRIDLNWISNLLDICDQRLLQNHHNLCSFQCIIDFSDGHRDIIYQKDSLLSYHSSRQAVTTGFDLSFSYLVDFANANEPEKQDIRIRVNSSFSSVAIKSNAEPAIYSAVSFSNLTWGEDLSRHISAHVMTAVVQARFIKVLRIAEKYSQNILYVIAAFFFVGVMWNLISSSGALVESLGVSDLIKNERPDLGSLSERIDAMLLMETDKTKFSKSFILFPALMLLPGLAPGALSYLLNKVSKSFVSLNQFTLEMQNADQDKNKRIKWILIGACITIPAGALLTYLRS